LAVGSVVRKERAMRPAPTGKLLGCVGLYLANSSA
jgi:hypothetical protein